MIENSFYRPSEETLAGPYFESFRRYLGLHTFSKQHPKIEGMNKDRFISDTSAIVRRAREELRKLSPTQVDCAFMMLVNPSRSIHYKYKRITYLGKEIRLIERDMIADGFDQNVMSVIYYILDELHDSMATFIEDYTELLNVEHVDDPEITPYECYNDFCPLTSHFICIDGVMDLCDFSSYHIDGVMGIDECY